jgi:hypothetical protein
MPLSKGICPSGESKGCWADSRSLRNWHGCIFGKSFLSSSQRAGERNFGKAEKGLLDKKWGGKLFEPNRDFRLRHRVQQEK